MYLSSQFRARLVALTPDGRRRLVGSLEGRPCSCGRMHLIPLGCTSLREAVRSLGTPCRHVAGHLHHLSVDCWSELLALIGDSVSEDDEPNDYTEPYRPLVPACAKLGTAVVTREGRIQLMTRREADHERLRDPDDEAEQDRTGEGGDLGSPAGENAYGSGAVVLDAEDSRPRPPPVVNACTCLLCRLARLRPEGGEPCPH